MNYIMEQWE